MHSTFICVFSVDFQKHASEYEVACFWKLTENTHIKWNAYSEFWILKIDREYTYQYRYIGGMQIARGARTCRRIPIEDYLDPPDLANISAQAISADLGPGG